MGGGGGGGWGASGEGGGGLGVRCRTKSKSKLRDNTELAHAGVRMNSVASGVVLLAVAESGALHF